MFVAVFIAYMLATTDGSSAAAGEKSAAGQPPGVHQPVALGGRWQGLRYGYAFRGKGGQECRGKQCQLTYDIVACGAEWCGIVVTDDATCGPIALRLTVDASKPHGNRFTGKLELAQGAAPYTVEGWYGAPDPTAGGDAAQKAAHLGLVGDTGSELLMMRRSFPFQADLKRIADATCTLEKATS